MQCRVTRKEQLGTMNRTAKKERRKQIYDSRRYSVLNSEIHVRRYLCLSVHSIVHDGGRFFEEKGQRILRNSYSFIRYLQKDAIYYLM